MCVCIYATKLRVSGRGSDTGYGYIYLSIYLSTYQSACLSMYLAVYQYINLSKFYNVINIDRNK